MSGHHTLPEGKAYSFGGKTKSAIVALTVLGIGLTAFGFSADHERAWKTVLIGYMLMTYIGLGAAFIQGIQYVANAAWGLGFRRIPEALVNILPVSILLYVPLVLIGRGHVWGWIDPDLLAPSLRHFLVSKAWYLNVPGFMFRDILFLSFVTLVTQLWRRWSLAQDRTADEKYTVWSTRLGAGFLVVWAVGICMFGFDMLMSLDFKWFSSMFGVYTFVGCFLSGLSATTLLTLWHRRPGGALEGVVSVNNIHDLGKLMFGFTVFWAYIGFGQMLIVWYADLPDETVFFKQRWDDGWASVSLWLIGFRFVFPFFFLLRRVVKRTPALLAFGAAWVLAAEVYDLYWIAIPTLKLEGGQGPCPSLWDIGPAFAGLGILLYVTLSVFAGNKTVPSQDPRFDEFLHHHQ
jgi:hypothetical protein